MKPLIALALLFGGCVTAQATAFEVPRERGQECRANCAQLDMDLAAVVIIMNSAGCVCQPRGNAAVSLKAPAAAIAGGAAITAARQQQQQQAAQAANHH